MSPFEQPGGLMPDSEQLYKDSLQQPRQKNREGTKKRRKLAKERTRAKMAVASRRANR